MKGNRLITAYALTLVILLMATSFLSFFTVAHTPQDMELEYNYESQSLTVMITHNTPTPDSHYIEFVEIYVNDTLYQKFNYTSQPTTSKFSYFFDVYADDGDIIKVVANCSISGSITKELTVQMPKPNPGKMQVVISNYVNELDEEDNYQFNITITESPGDFAPPISGVTINVSTNFGVITDIAETTGGQYKFKYAAPEVSTELIDTVNITAVKDGYDTTYLEFTLKIKPVEKPDDSDKPTLDGKIDSKEYDHDAAFQGGLYKIYWKVDGDTINIAMLAKTKGWVALGIEPESRMKDADMMIGWVESSGNVKILDAFSTGPTGPHPSDLSLGGTTDIIAYGGSQDGNWTIIEFSRKLDTGDEYDKVLSLKGKIDIIWAYGSNDDDSNQHSDRGVGIINLTSGESEEVKDVEWRVHALLMTLGLLSILLGVAILISGKDRMARVPAHKVMATLGSVFIILGILYGFYMIQVSTGEHFGQPIGFLGISTVIILLISLRFGFILVKNDPEVDMVRYKINHKWISRIAILFIIINILMGLSIAGVI